MFIGGLFMTTNPWRQSRCPLLMSGLRKFIYNGILLSHKEE
jgi:hypothetical protein